MLAFKSVLLHHGYCVNFTANRFIRFGAHKHSHTTSLKDGGMRLSVFYVAYL